MEYLDHFKELEKLRISKKDIRWNPNELENDFLGKLNYDFITDFYINNDYGRKTRWQLWNLCIDLMKYYNIESVLDIGTGNGHFVYLGVQNQRDIYGIEPCKNLVDLHKNQLFFKDRIFNASIKTFYKYFKNKELKVDCITILNFLHGVGHKKTELNALFKIIKRSTKYLIASEPLWDELGMKNILEKYPKIVKNLDIENKHHMWKIN